MEQSKRPIGKALEVCVLGRHAEPGSQVRRPGLPIGKLVCLYKENDVGSKLETARTGCGSLLEGRQCWAILFSIRTLVGPETV